MFLAGVLRDEREQRVEHAGAAETESHAADHQEDVRRRESRQQSR